MLLLNVKISIDDGKGKSAELTISESDNLAKLVIIQNVFNLFGIEKDLMDQVKTFDKAAQAYSQFFNETNPIEPDWNEEKEATTDIKQKLIESYEENKDELDATYKETKDLEYIQTGIKISEDGLKRYKLHYICSSCNHRGVHYVFEYSKDTWCHSCKYMMQIYPAHPELMERDSRGNFFRAGEYKDYKLSWTIG